MIQQHLLKVLAASVLCRAPRFYLYYWLLATTGNLFSLGWAPGGLAVAKPNAVRPQNMPVGSAGPSSRFDPVRPGMKSPVIIWS
jgi:hypothetical protein